MVALVAYVALYVAIVWTWHPRADSRAEMEPLRIARPAAVAGEATVLFAGDTAVTDQSFSTVTAKGFLFPFGSTIDLVREADVAVANVEAPVTDGGTRFPVYKDYVYHSPAAFAPALAAAGFDVAALANNHALDYGRDGLADSVENLSRAGLAAIGAGRDAAEARRGVVVDVGGLRVGLLAYCERQLLWDVYVDQFARAHRAGVAMAAQPDLDRDVARLRARADVVVVSLHVGRNYAPPSAAALDWGRRAIDAGADLVVEHHPHVAHPVALHRGRAILLSIGNYAFGTTGRFDVDRGDIFNVGLLARAHAQKCPGGGAAIDRLELIPLAVQNSRVHYRPEPLAGADRAATLARLRERSAAYGAEVTDGLVTLAGCAK